MKKALALVLGLALAVLVVGWGERHYRELEQLEGLDLVWGERIFVLKGKHINSHGFRERELGLDKPRGLTRIVAVGDSVTFGAGVRVHETWTRQAELMLSDQRRVQIVNLGVYSYDVQQVAATLHEVGWDWQPDLVVYGAFTNDHVPTDLLNTVGGPVYVGRTVAPELPLPALGTALLPHSALVRRAYGARAARTFPAPRRAEWGGDLGWWSEQLQAMAADCEQHDVPLLVYGLTEHTLAGGCSEQEETCAISEERTAAMELETERLGLPFASSVPWLRASGREAFHHERSNAEAGWDWAHPDAQGHTLLALGLVDAVQRLEAGEELASTDDPLELPEDWPSLSRVHVEAGRRPNKKKQR